MRLHADFSIALESFSGTSAETSLAQCKAEQIQSFTVQCLQYDIWYLNWRAQCVIGCPIQIPPADLTPINKPNLIPKSIGKVGCLQLNLAG
jgi:hypothetical protein